MGMRRTALLTVTLALPVLLATSYGCSQAAPHAEKPLKEGGEEVTKEATAEVTATASPLTVASTSPSSAETTAEATSDYRGYSANGLEKRYEKRRERESASASASASDNSSPAAGGPTQTKEQAQAYLEWVDKEASPDSALERADLALVVCRLDNEEELPAHYRLFGGHEDWLEYTLNKIERNREVSRHYTRGTRTYSYAGDELGLHDFDEPCSVLWQMYEKA